MLDDMECHICKRKIEEPHGPPPAHEEGDIVLATCDICTTRIGMGDRLVFLDDVIVTMTRAVRGELS